MTTDMARCSLSTALLALPSKSQTSQVLTKSSRRPGETSQTHLLAADGIFKLMKVGFSAFLLVTEDDLGVGKSCPLHKRRQDGKRTLGPGQDALSDEDLRSGKAARLLCPAQCTAQLITRSINLARFGSKGTTSYPRA